MGTSALTFSHAQPDTDAGFAAALAKLEQLMARAGEAATAQRSGIIAVRAASARKRELRRTMLSVHIRHLAEVGQAAAREEHELGKTFRFKPGASTLLAFQTAALSMAAEAETHREILIKHGLAAPVLEEFVQLLDQFDAAVKLGNDGRAAHMGATAELQVVAAGIVRTVRVMDGRNRQRFQDDRQLLGAWMSASTVLGTPRGVSSTEPVPGSGAADGATPVADVRPAA